MEVQEIKQLTVIFLTGRRTAMSQRQSTQTTQKRHISATTSTTLRRHVSTASTSNCLLISYRWRVRIQAFVLLALLSIPGNIVTFVFYLSKSGNEIFLQNSSLLKENLKFNSQTSNMSKRISNKLGSLVALKSITFLIIECHAHFYDKLVVLSQLYSKLKVIAMFPKN